MESSSSHEVLRCELCSKPFDKEASLRRHVYYCREKKSSTRRARMRSCIVCIKAKTRCDTARPSCARCAARHVPCYYPGSIMKPKASSTTSLLAVDRLGAEIMDSFNASSAAISSDESAESIEGNIGLLGHSFASFGSGSIDWNLSVTFQDDQNHSQFGHIDPPFIPVPPQSGQSAGSTDHLRTAESLQDHLILRMPTYHLRSFAQSKAVMGRSSASATLMTHILTSYPRIMYTPGSLPPFIHPYSLGQDSNNPSGGFESLTTCVTLMQMVSSGAPGSRKLFWKNVRLECERLRIEMLTFDKWNLLSAMQALTVYILVRLQEGETPDNNHDVLILSTFWIVACALNQQVNFGLCIARSGLYYGSDRGEWIFEESRRRLALVYQVLKMLYSLDPATSCAESDGFLLAPLPSRKQIWEAADARSWATEKILDGPFPSVFAVLTGGKMVRLQEQQTVLANEINFPLGVDNEESAANWREWCAGMDELGALAMLAASLSVA